MRLDPILWLRHCVGEHEAGRRISVPLEAYHLEEFGRLPRDPGKQWDALATLLIDLRQQVRMPNDLHLFGLVALGEVSVDAPPVQPADPAELASL